MKTPISERIYQLLQWHVIMWFFILGGLITLYISAIFQCNGFDEGDAISAIIGVNVIFGFMAILFGVVSYSLLIDLLFGKEIFNGSFKSFCVICWGVFSLICVILIFNNFVAPLASGNSSESLWRLHKEANEEQRQFMNKIIDNHNRYIENLWLEENK